MSFLGDPSVGMMGGEGLRRVVALASGANATSIDGITWTDGSIGAGVWRSVVWNGTIFCAVGNDEKCSTSTDGNDWTSRTIPTGDWNDVIWDGSQFIAVGYSTVGICATSPDGITWTSRTIANRFYYSVGYNGSNLFSTHSGTSGSNSTSPDAVTWTEDSTLPSTSGGIVYGGGVWVAAGSNSGVAKIYSSADGKAWTERFADAVINPFRNVAYSGSVFCAVGNAGLCCTSTDGTSWTVRTLPDGAAGNWMGVAWNGNLFVAVSSGNQTCATSPDGVTWTEQTITAASWVAVG